MSSLTLKVDPHDMGVVQVWYRIGGNKIEEKLRFEFSKRFGPRLLNWIFATNRVFWVNEFAME